jgi:hypothetical protein
MKKYLIIIPLVLLALAAAVFIYLKDRKLKDFEPVIIDKLAELVREGTNGLYRLEIGSLEVDLIGSRISLVNARLLPDSTTLLQMERENRAPNDVIFLSVDRMNIEGAAPAAFMQSRMLELDTLIITNPKIEIHHTRRDYNKTVVKDTTPVEKRILDKIDRIKLDRLLIQDAQLVHINISNNNKRNHLDSVTIDIQDILIDSASVKETDRLLYAREILIRMQNYEYRSPDSIYIVKADEVFISATKRDMLFSKVELKPRLSRKDFVKKQREVKELYSVYFNEIRFESVDWWAFANEEGLVADSAILSGGKLEVYCNRALPPYSGSKVGNYPHQALMKIPFDVNIKKLDVRNFDVAYVEYNPKSGQEGTLSFRNVRGEIRNATNMQSAIAENPRMTAKASASLLGEVSIYADFRFDLNKHESGSFGVDIAMNAVDGTKLNKVTHPLGLFSIKEGQIKSLKAHIEGSNHKGTGRVDLLYSGLKVLPLKQDDEGELKERGFLGFLANAFVVKSDNLPGPNQRVARVEYQRETNKSFFALIWKTLLTGMLESIGAPSDLAKPSTS